MDGDSGDEGNDELGVWDQIRMISLHDQQAGKVPWEADSRDRVMRDGKSGCWPSDRKRKVGVGREKVTTSEERVLRWGWMDQIILIWRLSGGEDFVGERKNVEQLSYRLRWWTFSNDLYTVRA